MRHFFGGVYVVERCVVGAVLELVVVDGAELTLDGDDVSDTAVVAGAASAPGAPHEAVPATTADASTAPVSHRGRRTGTSSAARCRRYSRAEPRDLRLFREQTV